MAKARRVPDVADPAAKSKLEQAAASVGLSVEALVDLAYDSGVRPAPPSDGITERYSLLDMGKRLWGEMQSVEKQRRHDWFVPLLEVQKGALIVALRDHGFRTEIIARDLQLNPEDVLRTWNNYVGKIGQQVVSVRLDTIAGQLQMAAERAQQIALSNEDARTYWQVEKDKVAILQSIGVVDRAIHRIEVTHGIEDKTRAELDALVQLEHKRTRSKIELVQIEQRGQEVDAIPAEIRDAEELDD